MTLEQTVGNLSWVECRDGIDFFFCVVIFSVITDVPQEERVTLRSQVQCLLSGDPSANGHFVVFALQSTSTLNKYLYTLTGLQTDPLSSLNNELRFSV